jgi:hypothetical protein
LPTFSCLGLDCSLDRLKAGLILCIIWIDLQALLVRIIGSDQVAEAVQSSSLPSPSLGPVRPDLCGLAGVLQSVLVVLLGSVRRRAVRVQNVIRRLDLNGFGKVLATGLLVSWEKCMEFTLLAYPQKCGQSGQATHMASSKFFSAMALLPRALRASAMMGKRLLY